MELRQLRYAVAVATYRHFTRAAASVPVAQPALSHQVRLLEQELGIELFERSRSGVRLTEAGEIFLLRARRALGEMDAAREEIAALKGLASGRLVLGAMQALAGLDLPRLLAAFHATHPGIDVSLREDSTRDMFTMAARGEIDLAIAALDVERPPGLDAVPLVREPVLVAVPIAHRLASLEAVALRQLRHETFILFKEGTGLRAVSERAAERAGFVPRVGFQTSSHDRLLALVGEGLGVALVPASAVGNPRPPGVAVLPALPGIDRTVGAVWRADHRHTPAASAFLSAAARARKAAGHRGLTVVSTALGLGTRDHCDQRARPVLITSIPYAAQWSSPSLVAAMSAPSRRSNWQAVIVVTCPGGRGSLTQVDQSITPSWRQPQGALPDAAVVVEDEGLDPLGRQ